MSAQARYTVTAIQLARNLLNEIQLDPKKTKEGKDDGIFDDYENYSYRYEIEKVKLKEIMQNLGDEENSANSTKGEMNIERLFRIHIEIYWEQNNREFTYKTDSFIFSEK